MQNYRLLFNFISIDFDKIDILEFDIVFIRNVDLSDVNGDPDSQRKENQIYEKLSLLIENEQYNDCYEWFVSNEKIITPENVIDDVVEILSKLMKNLDLENAEKIIKVGRKLIQSLDIEKNKSFLQNVSNIYASDTKISYFKGDMTEFYNKSLEYFKFARENAFYAGQADAESNIGIYHWKHGENQKALDHLQKSVDLAYQSNDPKRIGVSLNNRGIMYQANNNLENAIEDHKRAMEIHIENNHNEALPSAINSLGWVYLRLGKLNDAYDLFTTALNIAEKNDQKQHLSNYLANIGSIHQYRGEIDLAEEYYVRQLALNNELGNEIELARTYQNLGEIERVKQNNKEAINFMSKAKEIREKLNLKDDLMQSLVTLFEISLSSGLPVDEYFNKITTLQQQNENNFYRQAYNYCKGIKLKQENRSASNELAKELFTNIINESTTYYFDIQIQSTLHLCELLIFEYKAFQNQEILVEIYSILETLETEIIEQQLYDTYIHIILLKIKIATVNSEFEKIKAYFDTIDEYCQVKGLKLYSNIIQEEKLKLLQQKEKIRQVSRDLEIFENQYAIDDLEDYLRSIINKSYEYKNQIKSFHFELEDKTKCGITLSQLRDEENKYGLNTVTSSKCTKCTSIYSREILKEILIAHIMSKVCEICGTYPNQSQAFEILNEYESTNKETSFDAFLKINVPYRSGELQWNCENINCDNQTIYNLELEDLDYL